MISVEWEERGELHPPIAELFVRVALEAAGIRTDHRDLEKLELEHALNAEIHVAPLADVVTEPVAGPLPRAREGRAADYEWPFPRVNVEQREVRRLLFHEAPHVVNIQLYDTVRMGCVRGDRMRGQEAIRCRH